MGTLFIPEIFGTRHSLSKFLGFAETLSFPLALDPVKKKKKKCVWKCAVLQHHVKDLPEL